MGRRGGSLIGEGSGLIIDYRTEIVLSDQKRTQTLNTVTLVCNKTQTTDSEL